MTWDTLVRLLITAGLWGSCLLATLAVWVFR